MDLAYSIADLVVSRAGASSISELSLLKKACILVPSPNVSEDHQRKNAMALVEKDAAIMITDDKSREELVSCMLSLVKNEEQLNSLRNNITSFACPAAAEQIAIEVFKTIGITDPAILSNRKSTKPEPKKAKKFIFIEYFIVEEGLFWDSILEILEQKVKEGVEVRVMYDDFGCISTLPKKYYKTLEKKGIKVTTIKCLNVS